MHALYMATVRSFPMVSTIPRSIPAAMLRKLHALAEQRCSYFIELHRTGRWRRYYAADELAAQMREAEEIAKRFQQMIDESGANDPAPLPNVVPLFAKAS